MKDGKYEPGWVMKWSINDGAWSYLASSNESEIEKKIKDLVAAAGREDKLDIFFGKCDFYEMFQGQAIELTKSDEINRRLDLVKVRYTARKEHNL